MKGQKVLIVDDDEGVRLLVRAVMAVSENVLAVAEARDGAEAVSVAREFRPDVVVLDYHMPKMDGATAAGEIKRLRPDTQIVAFSGMIDALPEWADVFCRKDRVADLHRWLARVGA